MARVFFAGACCLLLTATCADPSCEDSSEVSALLQFRPPRGRATGVPSVLNESSLLEHVRQVHASAAHHAMPLSAVEMQAKTTELPFHVPFNGTYSTVITHTSAKDGVSTGIAAFLRADDSNVYVGLASNGGGFAGFGMNRRGPGMRNSDIVVCRGWDADAISARDFHSSGNEAPTLDASQDWKTIAGGRVQPTPVTVPSDVCPAGYTFGANMCYKVAGTAWNEKKTWEEARAACSAEGAQLAKIETDAQQAFLQTLFPGEMVAPDYNGESVGMWIGANEIGRAEGAFAWADGTPLSYANWEESADSADYSHGADYECGFMTRWSKRWRVGHCSSTSWQAWTHTFGGLSYACSKEASVNVPLADSNALPVTWCELVRPRTTCEADDDLQFDIIDFSFYALLAFSDPTATTDQLSYHGVEQRKVVAPVSFGTGSTSIGSIPNDAQTFRVSAPGTTVSSASGSYGCSYHVLPVSQKVHIVNFKVFLDSRSPSSQKGLQHHVDMQGCTQAVPGLSDGQNVDCAQTMQYCSQTLLSGVSMYTAAGETLPNDAGIPIGAGATQYVVISRHFYNPSGEGGVVDWGTYFDVTYTPTLRPNDFMTLVLSSQHINVPVGAIDHVVSSVCAPSCTQRLGGATQVRSVHFHMHGHGKRGIVKLVRDGQNLEPLGTVDPWDQSQSGYTVSRELLPGDALVLECHYDNDLEYAITYGDATNQEMCVAQISLVGPGSMVTCVDMPQGIHGQDGSTPPDACINPKTGRVWDGVTACDWYSARNYCPDDENPNGSNHATILVPHERDAALAATPYQPTAVDCKTSASVEIPAIAGACPLVSSALFSVSSLLGVVPDNERSDETSSDFTADSASAGVIVGHQDCGMPNYGYTVSWSTDCANREVTFELEAHSNGWLALGLIDAGTADAKLDPPATKMAQADIVQVKVTDGTLKDAWGSDYQMPESKATTAAELLSLSSVNGKKVVKFKRSFDSPDGVSLREDGFVYMLCALRSSSDAFTGKHEKANFIRTRVSLFGGTPESVVYAPGAEPEPEPESEGEAESEGEPESEAESEGEPESEAESEGEPESEAESEGEPESEAESEVEPESEGESEAVSTTAHAPTPAPPTPAPPTPAPPTSAPASCKICPDGKELQPSVIPAAATAGEYNCQNAEDWMQQNTFACAPDQGPTWWSDCCTDTDACDLCPEGVLQTETVAGYDAGNPYTCRDAENWMKTTGTCSDGRTWWGGVCCA